MAKQSSLGKELKGLGAEMAEAFKQMRDSREFKQLERDVVTGIKSISTSLGKALSAASKADQTKKLKNSVGRVIKVGAEEGKIKAQEAEKLAAEKLKQATAAIKQMSAKIKAHRKAHE